MPRGKSNNVKGSGGAQFVDTKLDVSKTRMVFNGFHPSLKYHVEFHHPKSITKPFLEHHQPVLLAPDHYSISSFFLVTSL